jgi:hypothetical protein
VLPLGGPKFVEPALSSRNLLFYKKNNTVLGKLNDGNDDLLTGGIATELTAPAPAFGF